VKCTVCRAWMTSGKCHLCEQPMKASEIAALVNGKLYGVDKSALGFTAANRARAINLTFCSDPSGLKNTQSEIVLSTIGSHNAAQTGQTVIEVENPKAAFAQALRTKAPATVPKIFADAVINSKYVSIGRNVVIKPLAVIGYEGFGFEPTGSGYEIFPHIGGVIIEDDVFIGSCTCVNRGKLEDTVIGQGTKIDNLVHVAHNVRLGKNCIVVAHTIIGGSVTIGNGVYIAMSAIIRDHVKIGDNAFIGMGAVVTKDVEPGVTVIGNPARPYQKTVKP